MSVCRYRETIWSDVFAGNRHTSHCLEPAVEATENALELSAQQRQRTVWRLDGGAGSDAHLRWLLARGYQVVSKGMNNRRAQALAQHVRRWDHYRDDIYLAEVAPTVDYGRKVRVFVKRRLKDGAPIYNYYVSTLPLSSKALFMTYYDDRGAAEIEQFRNDKGGLGLKARRKRSFCGQLGYILLTDLAHNLLADFSHRALAGSPFEGYGPKRIVRDLLATPGRLLFADGKLVRVELLSLKQFSSNLITCLEKYCATH